MAVEGVKLLSLQNYTYEEIVANYNRKEYAVYIVLFSKSEQKLLKMALEIPSAKNEWEFYQFYPEDWIELKQRGMLSKNDNWTFCAQNGGKYLYCSHDILNEVQPRLLSFIKDQPQYRRNENYEKGELKETKDLFEQKKYKEVIEKVEKLMEKKFEQRNEIQYARLVFFCLYSHFKLGNYKKFKEINSRLAGGFNYYFYLNDRERKLLQEFNTHMKIRRYFRVGLTLFGTIFTIIMIYKVFRYYR